jgi:hypothetical protein
MLVANGTSLLSCSCRLNLFQKITALATDYFKYRGETALHGKAKVVHSCPRGTLDGLRYLSAQ